LPAASKGQKKNVKHIKINFEELCLCYDNRFYLYTFDMVGYFQTIIWFWE